MDLVTSVAAAMDHTCTRRGVTALAPSDRNAQDIAERLIAEGWPAILDGPQRGLTTTGQDAPDGAP